MLIEKSLFRESILSTIELALGRGRDVEAQMEQEEGIAENSKSSNSTLASKNKEIAFKSIFPFQPSIRYHPCTGKIVGVEYPSVGAKSIPSLDVLSIEDNDSTECLIRNLAEDKEKEENAVCDNETLQNLIPEISIVRTASTAKSKKQPVYAINIDPLSPLPKDYDDLVKLPHQFPFELDLFQKHAIYHLERKESVFVAAHTSAGKTVVAEHAIATSLLNGTRTFYTSPIKALSNQKFGDFTKTFPPHLPDLNSTKLQPQVGLLTGDTQLNTEAPCLIMTTEILRGMLYRQSNKLMDLEFVIFDEVHYVNDAERGVVWEEVIMMLPRHVTLIMLSATIPNTVEFADWVGRIRGTSAVRVISTQKRPIPLTHHLFLGPSVEVPKDRAAAVEIDKSLACIVDHRRVWRKEDYSFAIGIERDRNKKGSVAGGGAGRNQQQQQQQVPAASLLSLLKRRSLLPAIIFFFSRSRLERQASSFFQSVDLCFGGAKEKSQIHRFLQVSISRLRRGDRSLPQVQRVKEMLLRGVGIHHSGLLPILREAVEHLFARGHVRLLLATETFAMGVNMPAKTVIFSSLKKHDGVDHRSLTSSEYTQMAGRAGRRGLDERGVVILLEDQIGGEEELKRIILGQPVMLRSRFKLSFKMIISLICRAQQSDDDAVGLLLSRSFGEASKARQIPELMQEYNLLKEEKVRLLDGFGEMKQCKHSAIGGGNDGVGVNSLFTRGRNLLRRLLDVSQSLLLSNSNSNHVLLKKGRLFLKVSSIWQFKLGLIVEDFTSNQSLKVLIMQSPPSTSITMLPQPLSSSMSSSLSSDESAVVKELSSLDGIVLLDYVISTNSECNPSHLMDLFLAWRLSLYKKVEEKAEPMKFFLSFQNNIKNSLEQQEMVILFRSLVEELPFLEVELQSLCPSSYLDHLSKEDAVISMDERMSKVFESLTPLSSFLPEYNDRLSYLVKKGYCSDDSLLTLKGRAAGEFSVIDEISSAELLFSGILSEQSVTGGELCPSVVVALVSGFVFEDRKECSTPPYDHISSTALLRMMHEVDGMIIEINQGQTEHFLHNQPAPLTVNWGMAEVVWRWVEGDGFGEIMEKMYDLLPSTYDQPLLEGTIVRTMVRIGEAIGELMMGVKIMSGTTDSVLLKVLEEGQLRLKRDICFAPSLYLC